MLLKLENENWLMVNASHVGEKLRNSGSLTPTFVPARLVGLTVKLAYAYTLPARFPSVPSQPLNASATL